MAQATTTKATQVAAPLEVFMALYIGAFLLHLSDPWDDPGYVLGFIGLGTFIVFFSPSILLYGTFLAASSLFYFFVRFPDLANHSNLILYINLSLLLLTAVGWRTGSLSQISDRSLFPFLRIVTILVYLLTGFHKLNHDFFHADASCIRDFLLRGYYTVGGVVLIAVIILLWALTRRAWRGALLALVVALLAMAGLVIPLLLPAAVVNAVVITLALLVVIWELGGGILLLFRRAQPLMLAACWVMHGSLAFIGFVDFSSLALALLFLFVPEPQAGMVGQRRIRLRGIGDLPAHKVYFLAVLLLVTMGALHHRMGIQLGNLRFFSGAVFNGAVLIFLWPLLKQARQATSPAWRGVEVVNPSTPGLVGILAGGLAFFGMSSYLGLRTAGNFTMFSNLRTEGARSNHLILGSNPLKLWTYQEDVVTILEVGVGKDDPAKSLEGFALPVVEFRKRIETWTKANRRVPIRFSYLGRVHDSSDIVRDPRWRSSGVDNEMFWMDFRPIQQQGPNRCRW